MNIKKRQEVINLMPWYNLGKLSDAEKSMLDEAFAEDPSLREQLNLDKDIMSKVLADPKLLDRSAFESSAIRLDKVLAQIDGTVETKIADKKQPVVKEKRQSVDLFAGVKAFFTDLLAGSSHSFTYGVFAALTAVQLALLVFFVVPSTVQQSEFVTSSGESKVVPNPSSVPLPDNKSSGLVLLFPLKDNISIEGITGKSLGDLKLELLPDSDGHYRVRLNRELTPDEIEVVKNELSRKTAKIVFVGE